MPASLVAEASLGVSEEYMMNVYEEYLKRCNFVVDSLNRIYVLKKEELQKAMVVLEKALKEYNKVRK